jgi:D-glycero-D-manno-heptose 1,7-bisphosphate phosphatase
VPRPALFLDRDGVINAEVDYLGDPRDVALIPGVAGAIAAVNARGVPVVVITNQSGIARGRYGEPDLAAVNARIAEQLAAGGARVDAVYACPHHPGGTVTAYAIDCRCRKPGPKMLEDAAAALDLDLARSIVVGDKPSDLGAARAAGCAAAVLVRTGYGATTERDAPSPPPDAVFDDLAAAVPWLLARLTGSAG